MAVIYIKTYSDNLKAFQGDTSVVVLIVLCFGVEFLCCLSLMYVFLLLVQFG